MEIFGILLAPFALLFLGFVWMATCKWLNLTPKTAKFGYLALLSLPVIGGLSLFWWVSTEEPLYFAASEGKIEEVRTLLARGADPNVQFEGSPAIVSAAAAGHIDVVKLLIKSGARLNVTDGFERQTPIMAAKANNHPEIVEILRTAGEKE